ncbi:uncharacterized protein LOC111718104 [Eurytemora carolleeae]|uniref:uncharacterized protein LOC111718104 n=1 Tax=Eurytemora carolleeae TaxID=1294199 RepID=UPI000C77CBFC|nr:uncharacterized protein LOC111718104 [Eurytemora carolleeae]|eukprot:XP_023349371.1 uncharacterized protein LOC111718104 [Eurytemora affinis]
MNDERSDHRMNLTDVFLHLIQPKFKNVFGEHYYRTVISHLDKTTESIIVISHILLDPDQENLYHATKIWYSELGYVTFGRWKLFPSNLEVTRSRVVPIRYYPFLSDRSYLAPQAPEFQNVSPILTITLPSAIVVFCCIIIVVGTLVFMHWFAFEKDSDRYKIFATDAKKSPKYP